jgi:gas vesicle protein
MIGRRQKSNFKRVAIGSGIAAAAGFVAGVLTAPKSGKETRADIKTATNKG